MSPERPRTHSDRATDRTRDPIGDRGTLRGGMRRTTRSAAIALLPLCFVGCDEAKESSSDSKGYMSMAEMEAVIAKAEAKESDDLQAKAAPVFAKHEALGDACVDEADATLREQLRNARAGEDVDTDTSSPACDRFWKAVAADLSGTPPEKLGVFWANWRDAQGKPRPSVQ